MKLFASVSAFAAGLSSMVAPTVADVTEGFPSQRKRSWRMQKFKKVDVPDIHECFATCKDKSECKGIKWRRGSKKPCRLFRGKYSGACQNKNTGTPPANQDHCVDVVAPPSPLPSRTPSKAPSDMPSVLASSTPSKAHSNIPSVLPSSTPSKAHSNTPSVLASRTPSKAPSNMPSPLPSRALSKAPSSMPSPLASPTPTMPVPEFSISAVCPSYHFNTDYYYAGTNDEGTKFWRDSTSVYYFYWRHEYKGWGARWVIDDDKPVLDGNNALYGHFVGQPSDDGSSDPPFGQSSGRLYCDGSFTDGDIVVANSAISSFPAKTGEREGIRVHDHKAGVPAEDPDHRAITD